MDIKNENFDRKKILFAELDGTLIESISSSIFPKGVWDMKFRFDVLDAIGKCNFKILCIVSNQGGIEYGFVNEDHFVKKMEYIKAALTEYLQIPIEYSYCGINDVACEFRKPNTGLLKKMSIEHLSKYGLMHGLVASKDEMLMIGDASGKTEIFLIRI